MHLKYILLSSLFFATSINAQNFLSKEDQINSAIQVAPENERNNATVIGYNERGNQVVLRKGTGNLICLTNNPKSKSFSIACYQKDLESLMARGRALRKLGKSMHEIETIRAAEAKSGKLILPKHPSTLYVLYGRAAKYDKVTKKVVNGHIRYVIYVPWATIKSIGLPTKPQVPGGPWLMRPGSYIAHIMITPPSN